MTTLNEKIITLTTYYQNLPWYYKFFFPTQLAKALTELSTSPPNETDKLKRTILKLAGTTSWISRWFFNELNHFYRSCDFLLSHFDLYEDSNENATANLNLVLQHQNPCAINELLSMNATLNDADREDLAAAADPVKVMLCINLLKRYSITDMPRTQSFYEIIYSVFFCSPGGCWNWKQPTPLLLAKSEANSMIKTIINSSCPSFMAQGLLILQEADISTAKNRELLKASFLDPYDTACILRRHKEWNLPDNDPVLSLERVILHSAPYKLMEAWHTLHQSHAANEANCEALYKSRDPINMARGLRMLPENTSKINPELYRAVSTHSHPVEFAIAMNTLQEQGLFSDKTPQRITTYATVLKDIRAINENQGVLIACHQAGLFKTSQTRDATTQTENNTSENTVSRL